MFLAVALVLAAGLDRAVEQAMAGRQGTVVVLEVATGRVLAAHRLEAAARMLVRPGSTVKPFVPVPRDQKALCDAPLRLAGRNLDCSHAANPRPLGRVEALAYSCNRYFANAALRLREGELEAALRRAIPAAPTGLAPGEASGSIERARTLEERQLQALGEAGITVTPLAMLAAYRKLALQGEPAEAIAGLEAAAQYGTARLARPPGMTVAGKTGTSTEPGSNRRHAWFVGWAPARAPAIAVLVFIEHGRGGWDAAPVAREIFSAYRPERRDQVTVRRYWLSRRDEAPVSMDLEEYVAAVLAGECSAFRSAEALKAMAVAVRTFAVRNRGRHARDNFDFCDTTHCQDYRGVAVTARFREAAEATRGEMVWHQGSPASLYYHADCAGITEAVNEVWPGSRQPYLRSQPDAFCTARGSREWHSEIRVADIARALTAGGLRAPRQLRSVAVTSRTASGRAALLELVGEGRTAVAASSFRFAVGRALGWDLLRSTWFEIRDGGDRMVFTGRGSGHGVGLCQNGAARMAEGGRSYREVLEFYFPGTTVGVGARGFAWQALAGERIEVLTTRPAQDGRLPAAADRLAREAERRTGFEFRQRPQIRIFPSVEAFRDATGEPGWVAASTRGRVIRTQPPGANFEATLLHELLHQLVETHAHARLPLWFREGLVLHLAAPSKPPGADAVSDADFRGGTRAQMQNAYEAARSRVRRMVDRHGEGAVLAWVASGLPSN